MMKNRDVVILGRGKRPVQFPEKQWRNAIRCFLEQLWQGKLNPDQTPAIVFGCVELQLGDDGIYHLYLRGDYNLNMDDHQVVLLPRGRKTTGWSQAEVHNGLADFTWNDATHALTIQLQEGYITLSKVERRGEYRCQVTLVAEEVFAEVVEEDSELCGEEVTPTDLPIMASLHR